MAIIGKWETLDVDGYSPPRASWKDPSKNYYTVELNYLSSANWETPTSQTTQCTILFFNDDALKNMDNESTGEIKNGFAVGTYKKKPKGAGDVGKPWSTPSKQWTYVSLKQPNSTRIIETNNPKVYCKLYKSAKKTGDNALQWYLKNVKFTGDWSEVDCEVPRPSSCVIPPSITELLNQNDKHYFVIAKAKPSLHHALYLFNANTVDIVYSVDGDMRSNITALKNVPRYNVFDCKWIPAGKANLRFSDCSDDLCENPNAIIANGLDQIIKDKIGKLQAGRENEFLAEKFPTCCAIFDKDSTLAPEIGDLLEQEGKTFYLLGKKADGTPKLYLFDLGQVLGGLTYKYVKDAVVYKQVECKWVKDAPPKQDLKFSELKGAVDTNFYLLTADKLDKPSTITEITHRKANEYLLKYFPTCSVKKPEGGGSPNDNLKPDFGGGNGGIGGSGGEGFFPDVNNPLPNPEVPSCSGQDGGSQTPVSEIYLLSVPELSPTYNDTYDFASASDQAQFFINKRSFKLINYSYLRKENAIQVGSHVDNLKCYNYLMYKNKAGKWYYCFIMDKQYINERTARIIIATDVVQTYLFDYVVKPSFVERCHVDRWNSDGTPTDEFEPEGLEFGEPLQVSWEDLQYVFNDTFVAVCANPLGEIPSRKKPTEQTKGVDDNV